MIAGQIYRNNLVQHLSQAVQNHLVIEIVHKTNGVHVTERAIVPAYLAYGLGANSRYVYLRGLHLNGSSFSGARPNNQRLFKLKNMVSIKQSGSFYRGSLPNYRNPDRGLGSKIMAQ